MALFELFVQQKILKQHMVFSDNLSYMWMWRIWWHRLPELSSFCNTSLIWKWFYHPVINCPFLESWVVLIAFCETWVLHAFLLNLYTKVFLKTKATGKNKFEDQNEAILHISAEAWIWATEVLVTFSLPSRLKSAAFHKNLFLSVTLTLSGKSRFSLYGSVLGNWWTEFWTKLYSFGSNQIALGCSSDIISAYLYIPCFPYPRYCS